MNNIDKNKIIINSLLQNFNNISEMRIEGNNLIYRDRSIDISNFDLERILTKEYVMSLQNKTEEEIFDNIYNQVVSLEKVSNKDKLEVIKKENPIMDNITIFTRDDLETHKKEEFINIRLSTGENYLFRNDINLDIFKIYTELKATYGDDITPNTLAKQIEKWNLNRLDIEKADVLLEKEDTKESFKSKLKEFVDYYKDRQIEANKEEEIIYINNPLHPEENMIITFDLDINNELVMKVHKGNVRQDFLQSKEELDNGEEIKNVEDINSVSDSLDGTSNMDYNANYSVISKEEFYYILNNGIELTDVEKEKVDNYFKNIQDLIENNKEEEYEAIINDLDKYAESLELQGSMTIKQEYAMNKIRDIHLELEKKYGINKGDSLKLLPSNGFSSNNTDNFGYSSILSIITIIGMIIVTMGIVVINLLK